MVGYLIRRSIQMTGVLLVSTMLIYFFLLAAPGGPLDGLNVTADQRARIDDATKARMEAYLGLHRGPAWGYVAWLTGEDWLDDIGQGHLQRPICEVDATRCGRGVIRGDFGNSWQIARGETVAALLESRLTNTLLLMGSSIVLSLLIAIPIGIYSAVNQYSRGDYLLTSFAFFGQAMPVFWFALLMIMLFGGSQSFMARNFEWFPFLPTGNVNLVRPAQTGSLHSLLGVEPRTWMDTAIHLILPTIVLSLLNMALWSRFMRTSMLEVLRQDYVRTARSKGLTERMVVYKHALRNALIPLVTVVVFTIPGLFSGAVITETVFNWTGMGRLFIRALGAFDYPVTMAFLFITAVLTVVATLMRDVIYTIVDPRIRLA